MTALEEICQILTKDLSPWTFSGEEPMVQDLLHVIERCVAEETERFERVLAKHRGCNGYDCGDCIGAIDEELAAEITSLD